MPHIKFAAFSGEQPRVIPRLMPDNAAQSAINTRLDDGGLTPHRVAEFEYGFPSMPPEGYQTIYLQEGTWLGWNVPVDAAPGPIADSRLYYTGDGVPKMRLSGGTVYPLALTAPTVKLTGALSGTATATDVTTRLYVYTRVTSLGEESEPSPLSNEILWQPGLTVTLSGFATAPAGRGFTTQRIYRSQTGANGTDLYFIAERADSASNYVDTIPVDQFSEVLPSRNWNPPVDTLQGLVAGPNGMMAAFSGKDLYFCEPYHPHAWPEIYSLQTQYPIIALAFIGAVLIIMTTGHPEVAQGTAPENMQMQRLPDNLPCINERGVVNLGTAVCYPSNDGLALATPGGGVSIITQNIFNRDDWLSLVPGTFVATQYLGRYMATYRTTSGDGGSDNGSLIIDVAAAAPFLIRSDVVAAAWFYDIVSGSTFYREDGSSAVQVFDPATGSRKQQYWKSKEHVLPMAHNFGAILIDTRGALTDDELAAITAARSAAIATNAALIAGGFVGGAIDGAAINAYPLDGDALVDVPDFGAGNCTVNVYADGVLRTSVSKLNKATRLKSGFLARRWVIDVSGDIRVEQVVIASTIDELVTVL